MGFLCARQRAAGQKLVHGGGVVPEIRAEGGGRRATANMNSMDPCFWFALEEELMQGDPKEDGVFLFWRTRPALLLGR